MKNFERGRRRIMEPDSKDELQLKSLTTDELKRLWVEACKSWAPTPDIEPLEVADVEAELDFPTRGSAFSPCAGGAVDPGESPCRVHRLATPGRARRDRRRFTSAP